MQLPVILGIESSCDDTAAAVIRGNEVLSSVSFAQTVHQTFGGVVPELASRAHITGILPVVEQALLQANISKSEVQGIAVTQGPGLAGSLCVGLNFAKSLSQAWAKPLIGVNHLKAHVLAHFLADSQPDGSIPKLPFLCLTVSGGHTMIVLVEDGYQFTILGKTQDDAAGEAYDKCGKLIGLPYPAGVEIDKLAKEGNPHAFPFGKPKMQGFEFSFSGLKTSVLYKIQAETKVNPNFIEENLNDLCASIQHSINTILIETFYKAWDTHPVSYVGIAGGVSANTDLRKRFMLEAEKRNIQGFIPKFGYTTDNAAMIAIAGKIQWDTHAESPIALSPKPKFPISE